MPDIRGGAQKFAALWRRSYARELKLIPYNKQHMMKIHTHHITPACSQLFIENEKRWYPLKIHNATIHKKLISYFLAFKFYKS